MATAPVIEAEAPTATAAALIAPFVGAKLNRVPDPAARWGGYLPLTAAIDILHRSHSVDASVRAVSADGVSVFFDSRCEMIPWASIRRITIRSLDAEGSTTSTTVYDPDGRGGFRVRDAEFDRIAGGQRKFGRARL